MITPKLILCAEGIVIDSQTNNISAFNILEELSPPVLPAILPRFFVLSVLERDEADSPRLDTHLRITVAEQVIVDQVFTVDFQGTTRARSVFGFGGMPLPQPGSLEVAHLRGDDVLQAYRIVVKPPPTPEPIPPGTNPPA